MEMNQDGKLILDTLLKIHEPATFTEILSYIADSAGVEPDDIQECVEATLEGGLVHGFIQCRNRKYFATSLELEFVKSNERESDAETEPERENKETEKTVMDDRSKRQRKGRRSRSRRRSRNRSRR